MLRWTVLMTLSILAACGGDAPCGVSWDGAEPELGTMVLSDGTTLSNGSWDTTRINAGTLTLDVRAMGDETTLRDALSAGEMPVCRTLDDQNDQVIYQDNGPGITNSSHTGTLAITEFSDESVKGQFTVTLRSTTGDTRELSGAFHVAPAR